MLDWHLPRLTDTDTRHREPLRERIHTMLHLNVVVTGAAQNNGGRHIAHRRILLAATFTAGHAMLHVPTAELTAPIVPVPLPATLRTTTVVAREYLVDHLSREDAQILTHDPRTGHARPAP